jgi:hypothetical protein
LAEDTERRNKKAISESTMTVGTFHRQQQLPPQQQHQFMAQTTRSFGTLNFYANHNQQQQQLTADTKGLLNGPGQNNCFLNCAVQVSAESITATSVERADVDE